jgi:hypothetical protein
MRRRLRARWAPPDEGDREPFEVECRACDEMISIRPLADGTWAACDLDPVVVFEGAPRAPLGIVTPYGERRRALVDDPKDPPREMFAWRLHWQTCPGFAPERALNRYRPPVSPPPPAESPT